MAILPDNERGKKRARTELVGGRGKKQIPLPFLVSFFGTVTVLLQVQYTVAVRVHTLSTVVSMKRPPGWLDRQLP